MSDPSLLPAPTPANKRERVKEILAYGVIGVVVLLILIIAFKGSPADDIGKELLTAFATAAILLWKEVYGYVFGSSQGSNDKNATIAQAFSQNPTKPQT